VNRAERRRLQREGLPVKKEPVINMKVSDVQRITRDSTKDAVDQVFLLMLGLPVLTLRDKWGFGKVRSERFIEQVLELYDSFEKGYLTLEDIKECLWDEAGIKIESKA
jgi:hypothetical protein